MLHMCCRFPPDVHATILSVLEKFDVGFQMLMNTRQESKLLDAETKPEADMAMLSIPSLRKRRSSFANPLQTLVIPHLLPEDRPPSFLDVWPLFPNKTVEYNRVFLMKFLPLGFFQKCLMRVLCCPGISPVMIWSKGVVVNGMNDDMALLEFSRSMYFLKLQVRLQKYSGLEKLLLSNIEQLIKDYYPNELQDISIPCTHCIKHRSYDPYTFSLNDLKLLVAQGQGYAWCRGIYPVRIGLFTAAQTHQHQHQQVEEISHLPFVLLLQMFWLLMLL